MIRGRAIGSIILLILFIILPLSYELGLSDYLLLATILILLFPSLMFFLKDRRGLRIVNKKPYIVFGIYILWLLLLLITNSNFESSSFLRIFQIVGCLSAFICGSSFVYEKKQLNFYYLLVETVIIFNLLFWALQGFPLKNYSFIFSNTASYGTIVFCWFLFLSTKSNLNKIDIVFLIACIGLEFVSSTRGALLAILCFVLVVVFSLKKKTYSNLNRTLNVILLFSIVVCFAFVFIYTEASYTEFGIKINNISREYFGKNLYSGRETIWHEMIASIGQRPFTGYGLDALPRDIYDTSLSAHNTFLQIALQSGITGLVLFLVLLVSIQRNILGNKNVRASIVGTAIIISIMVHECVEVCLVQNMLTAGLQMWFLMGLCFNPSVYLRGKGKYEL